MKSLFFGDSITQGEPFSFTSFLPYQCINLGVSGTTIGEYSVYPVDGKSLLSRLYAREYIIPMYDYVFLEYGINDVSAIVCNNVQYTQVVISAVKALDYIKRVAPEIDIYFLYFGRKCMDSISRGVVDYLKNDYFKNIGYDFDSKYFATVYETLIYSIKDMVKTVDVMPNDVFDDKYLMDDGIHFNESGCKVIASMLEFNN